MHYPERNVMRRTAASLAIVAACLALPAGAGAQTYQAENFLTVVPLSPTEFEVIEANGEGPRGIWCAAASYAFARAGVSPDQRLYVERPRGPSVSGAGRIGVVFTTREDQLTTAPTQSISLSVREAGRSLPQHHAYRFCRDYLIDRSDRL
jgi:hypothetical protein